MLIGKFLDPKNDYAFKRIFGTEKNKDILIHFLNDMLAFEGERKIQEVSFLKTAQDPDLAAKKQSLVDVLCQDEKGDQYIVEMQRDAKAMLDAALQAGEAKGRVEGQHEEKLAIAKKMLSEGLPLEIIAKVTSLDSKVIQSLQ